MMTVKALALSVVLSAITANAAAQQPPRDARRPDPLGTSSIGGRVLSDEPQPRPLRRARVMLNGAQPSLGRTAITGDDGAFQFDRLPAGRYTVMAAKESYLTVAYGARRPNGQGSPIQVADGQRRTVTLRLPKGAVITGTIVDPEGQPMPGVTVSAMTYRFVPNVAERRLVAAGMSLPATDDRGVYRIFGLPAGDYVVTAVVRQFAGGSVELRVLTTGEIQQALADVRHGSTRNDTDTGTGIKTDRGAATETRRGVAFAPVYYPGTAVSAQAATVTVALGEERAGIDIQLQYVPTATIEGMVVSPGSPQQGTPIMLTSSEPGLVDGSVRVTTAGPDGRFVFTGIPPGQYTAMVRPTPIGGIAGFRRPEAPAPAAASMFWALTSVSVQGEDVSGVALMLQPGLTISGRVVFEGAKPPAVDLSQLRVPLPGVQSATSNLPIPMPALRLDADGRFAITDVIPGPYRLNPTAQGIRSPVGAWWLKSIVINGRDLLDSPLELRQSADDAIVTFSDRATELTGAAVDARGDPFPSCFVVVFAANNAFWFPGSRRIAGVRPDASGTFTIRNLPPGDYLAVATDLDQGEWFDERVLQRLAPSAASLRLGDGEKKVQDLRVQ